MKVSKSSALKLLFIIAAVSIYTLVSFADSSNVAEPQRSSAESNAAESSSDKDTSKQSTAAAAQTQPRPVRSAGLFGLTAEDAQRRSAGCLDCHNGIEDMHSGVIYLGCIDCHGGKAEVRAQGLSKGSAGYEEAKKNAHVQPRFPEEWKTSANPERTYTQLLKESAEFIQFINPGDLRVAGKSCGTAECHQGDVHNVRKSMMTTGAMLWGAALYNNGSFPLKNYRFGESYSPEGTPQRIQTNPPPTPEQTQKKGILP
ncbi:MAG TPA: hypothetical protein VFO63_01085, partial [Blastocatellia bacterium]|nr:hypothetical protein [Blastocatellia bacterium]